MVREPAPKVPHGAGHCGQTFRRPRLVEERQIWGALEAGVNPEAGLARGVRRARFCLTSSGPEEGEGRLLSCWGVRASTPKRSAVLQEVEEEALSVMALRSQAVVVVEGAGQQSACSALPAPA